MATPEDSIRKQYEARDPSKVRGVASALGAGSVFGGPVGALIGLGVYALSRQMEKGEMEAAIEGYRASYEADGAQAGRIAEGFAQEFGFDQELYGAARVTDIDRKQHAMIKQRFMRAAAGLEHPDPAVRREAIAAMNEAADQRATWLEDIESRNEHVGDEETKRAQKLEDDISTYQRDLAKQSLAFQQQMKLQSERERITTERALLMDNLQTVKDAYRGKSASIRETDSLLAMLESESYTDKATGRRVLTQPGRAALMAHVEMRVNKSDIGGVLSAAGDAGGNNLVSGIISALGKSYGTLKAYALGENVSDEELIDLAKALDVAGDEHFDNIIGNTQPAIRRQAAAAGADEETALAGVTFDLTDRQREWRKAVYDAKWDTDRDRQNRGRPGDSTPGAAPADEADWGKTIMGGYMGYKRRQQRPVN